MSSSDPRAQLRATEGAGEVRGARAIQTHGSGTVPSPALRGRVGVREQLGRYRIIEELGRGGMGTIHLAVLGGIGRFRKLFVLKVLREDLTSDPQFIDLFLREAAVAGGLSHPNVVHTVEAGRDGDRYFLVMEFLDGQPFSQILRTAQRRPAVPLSLRLRIVCGALAGLHYVHELTDYDGRALDLVHRDVSPPNIFVTYDGQVKLLDFGIAKERDEDDSRPGEFKGKIGYAAPEQLRGLPADRRSDVFSAGVVLWEAIALRHLSYGKSRREALAARLAGADPRLDDVVPDVHPELAAICERAMHHDPEQRYATAQELSRALEDFLAVFADPLEDDALGLLMREKFAEARAKMHCLIDQVMREQLVAAAHDRSEEPAPRESHLALHSALPSAPPHSNDLPPDDDEAELAPAAPRRSRLGLVAGIAALSLALFFLRTRDFGGEAESRRAKVEPASPPAPSLEPPAPSPRETTRAENVSAPVEDASTQEADAAQPEVPVGVDIEEVRRPRRPSRRVGAGSADRPHPSRREDPERASSGGVDAAPGDLDLRGVQRRAPRRIDVENPFR